MTDNKERQYKNLRKNFNELVNRILGEDYPRIGGDVSKHDEQTCIDIADAYFTMEDKRNTWRRWFFVMCAFFIGLFIFYCING